MKDSKLVESLFRFWNVEANQDIGEEIPDRDIFRINYTPKLVKTPASHVFSKGYKANFESRINLAAGLSPRPDEIERLKSADFPKIRVLPPFYDGVDVPCWFGPRKTANIYAKESLDPSFVTSGLYADPNSVVLYQHTPQEGYLFDFTAKRELVFLELSSKNSINYLKELQKRFPVPDSYSDIDKIVSMTTTNLKRRSYPDDDYEFALWVCKMYNQEANLMLYIKELLVQAVYSNKEIFEKLRIQFPNSTYTNNQFKFAIKYAKEKEWTKIDGFFWRGTDQFHEEYMICNPSDCLNYSKHSGGKFRRDLLVSGVPTEDVFFKHAKSLEQITPQKYKDKYGDQWKNQVGVPARTLHID